MIKLKVQSNEFFFLGRTKNKIWSPMTFETWEVGLLMITRGSRPRWDISLNWLDWRILTTRLGGFALFKDKDGQSLGWISFITAKGGTHSVVVLDLVAVITTCRTFEFYISSAYSLIYSALCIWKVLGQLIINWSSLKSLRNNAGRW